MQFAFPTVIVFGRDAFPNGWGSQRFVGAGFRRRPPIGSGGTLGALTDFGGTLFLTADERLTGRELWKVPTPPRVLGVVVGRDLKSVIVQFDDDDLRVAAATDVANYRLPASRGDANGDGDPFNDGDEVTLAISAAAYDAAADRVTLTTANVLFNDLIRLHIDGDYADSDGTAGVVDRQGNLLAGGDASADLDLVALGLVRKLITRTEAMGLTRSQSSLLGKLEATVTLLGVQVDGNGGVLALLEAFVRGIEHWYARGQISATDRDALLSDAELILLGISALDSPSA